MEPILTVENLTKKFTQDGSDFFAVNNISFQLFPGDCLAIVGESGCGKSTTVKLITRLIDADSGKIHLGGKDITQATGKSLRDIYKKMQMVFQFPQDSFNPHQKLDSAIIEPLINGGMSKTKARKHLPQLLNLVGLNYSLVDGRYARELSGGQCQRAALARALAVKPEILICDEATSALDTESERLVQEALDRLMENRTTLVIAHRLSTIKNADLICVMHEGKIVERGTHDELIALNRYYKRLVDMQKF